MKLSIKGLAITVAIIWSLALLIIAGVNNLYPDHGINFLEKIGSVYPRYQPGTGISSVKIASLNGAIDAGIGAAIFAWLYTFCRLTFYNFYLEQLKGHNTIE